VIDVLANIVIGISLCVGLGIIGLAVADRRPLTLLAYGLVTAEVAALAQVLVAIVQAVRGERPNEVATFIGYALTSVLVAPIGALWALSDKSRWGTGAAGVAALVLAVLTVRMQQVWG
jgi:crotonobetainyl-CoA:carnitine CoA-transferase CaiB-like acyl-CoA transferase